MKLELQTVHINQASSNNFQLFYALFVYPIYTIENSLQIAANNFLIIANTLSQTVCICLPRFTPISETDLKCLLTYLQ